jgi:hypothetical protein
VSPLGQAAEAASLMIRDLAGPPGDGRTCQTVRDLAGPPGDGRTCQTVTAHGVTPSRSNRERPLSLAAWGTSIMIIGASESRSEPESRSLRLRPAEAARPGEASSPSRTPTVTRNAARRPAALAAASRALPRPVTRGLSLSLERLWSLGDSPVTTKSTRRLVTQQVQWPRFNLTS